MIALTDGYQGGNFRKTEPLRLDNELLERRTTTLPSQCTTPFSLEITSQTTRRESRGIVKQRWSGGESSKESGKDRLQCLTLLPLCIRWLDGFVKILE
jgi:hypothetical protein